MSDAPQFTIPDGWTGKKWAAHVDIYIDWAESTLCVTVPDLIKGDKIIIAHLKELAEWARRQTTCGPRISKSEPQSDLRATGGLQRKELPDA